jgi:hypothetical protein
VEEIKLDDETTLTSFEDIKRETYSHYATLYMESGNGRQHAKRP